MKSNQRKFDQDRTKGVLIGLAAGDKNLGHIEMALMIAESLITNGEFDLSDITAVIRNASRQRPRGLLRKTIVNGSS